MNKLWIKNADKIYTISGGILENTDILVEGTQIKALLPSEPPSPLTADFTEAEIIDASGLLIFPGFIDAHCHVGLWEEGIGFEGSDGNEMTDPVTPHLRGLDGINPLDEAFQNAVKGGVTVISTGPGSANVLGGTFSILKTYGHRVDDMILEADHAMKCAFGENPKRVYNSKNKMPMTRMGIAGLLRETLGKAKEYAQKKSAAHEQGDPSKMPAYNMKMEAMERVINREIPLKAHAHRADDIFTSIRIAKEFGVKLTLEHCTEGHLIADDLAREGYPAVVGPSFGNKSKFELNQKSFITPGVLHQAGVKVAIMTDAPVIPIEYLPMCAAYACKAGMPEEAALRAISLSAAEILGISDRVGSIEVGKDADLVLWDNHPFSLQSVVKSTIINGKPVFQQP